LGRTSVTGWNWSRRFYVQVEKRPKLACPRCKQGVTVAPASETPLPGALPGPGLLAQLLVGKYRDGLPLYRQQGIFAQRYGVKLPASTLGDWVAAASDVLSPVVELLKRRTLADGLLHTDDTGVRVLDRDDARGVKRGHLWPYLGQRGNVFVEYTPDWSGKGPQAVLADFKGYLVVDGYAGYQALFGPASPRIEVGCWMHARRGFECAWQAGDSRGGTVLALIQKLYAVERQASEAPSPPRPSWRCVWRRALPSTPSSSRCWRTGHLRCRPRRRWARPWPTRKTATSPWAASSRTGACPSTTGKPSASSR
jgi:hypothetical protein